MIPSGRSGPRTIGTDGPTCKWLVEDACLFAISIRQPLNDIFEGILDTIYDVDTCSAQHTGRRVCSRLYVSRGATIQSAVYTTVATSGASRGLIDRCFERCQAAMLPVLQAAAALCISVACLGRDICKHGAESIADSWITPSSAADSSSIADGHRQL